MPSVWQLRGGEVALKLVPAFLLLCRVTVMASGLLQAIRRLLSTAVKQRLSLVKWRR